MAHVFVPKERSEGETLVAASPEKVKRLVKEGFEVLGEAGVARRSSLVDSQFEAAGAKVVAGDAVQAGRGSANVVVKMALRDREASALSMELVPRISHTWATRGWSAEVGGGPELPPAH